MNSKVGIRCYRPEDAAALHEAAIESRTDVYAWLSWCHLDYSLAEAEAWATSQQRLFEQGEAYEFVIIDGEDRFLGGCGLNRINPTDRVANLGYWVRNTAVGRGVATRAVRLLADFAFSETELERLEIVCAVGNEASRRVAEKAGAVREGVLRGRIYLHGVPRDAVIYSILRFEWGTVT